MFVSFRTALLTLAALVPASVAPAKVLPINVAPAALEIAASDIPEIVTPTLIGSQSESAKVPAGDDVPDNGAEVQKVPGESLSSMVSRLGTGTPADREQACLATAIYFEAKSEPLAGQLAVGEVLSNRIKSGRFASSFCGVVMQRGQFSFVRNGSLPNVARSSRQWRNAVAIASIVGNGMMNSQAPRALFFHAKRVSPGWHATRVATIGNHIFFR